MTTQTQLASTAERGSLVALAMTAFAAQNALAIPYVRKNGPKAVLDFFIGDIYKTVPGRFAMVDLIFVVIAFHTWAFAEARRLGIVRWWAVSFVLTFAVGIATAIPFFFVAREKALRKAALSSAAEPAR